MAGGKTLTGGINLKANWTHNLTLGGRVVRDSDQHRVKFNWAAGNLKGQVDEHYSQEFAVTAASPTLDFDLIGILTDVFGFTINAAKILAVLLENQSTTAGQLLRMGGAGSVNNAWEAPFAGSPNPDDATVDVGSESAILLGNFQDGYEVLAGSKDVLRIVNVSATEDMLFRLTFFGRTS